MNRPARILPLLIVAALCPAFARGGANADGGLIVHADPFIGYTASRDYCESDFRNPGDCLSARTRVDLSGDPVLVWFIAAFPSNAGPSVTAVQFGLETTVPRGSIVGHGACGSMILELPDPGFPGPFTGNLVSLATERRTFFPVYWFAVEAESGDRFGSGVYPGDNRAVFVDDGSPPAEDQIRRFGSVEWGANGENDCPPSAFETKHSSWGDVKAGYR